MRRVFGIVVALLAVAATYGFGIVLYQTLSGDYVGGEVAIVWTITGVVGAISVGLWVAAFGMLSVEENRRRIFGYLWAGVALSILVGVAAGFVTETDATESVGTTAPSSGSD